LDDLDVGEIALAEAERRLVPAPHPIQDVDLVHGRIALEAARARTVLSRDPRTAVAQPRAVKWREFRV
jgi:hypothetical protein